MKFCQTHPPPPRGVGRTLSKTLLKVPDTGEGFCDCLDDIGVSPWSVVGRKQNIVTKLAEAEPQRAPLPVNVPFIGNVELTPVTQFLPRPLYSPQGVSGLRRGRPSDCCPLFSTGFLLPVACHSL